ncbi:MAG TPA: winged helix DNA-binding domain-containing protein [Streptosporangiaceae bacterium]
MAIQPARPLAPHLTVIGDVDIARWRLRSQRLVAPFAGSAHDVILSLLGVQAENPGQAAWAVAARTQRRDPSDLATLLDEGAVLRTHVLRPTWHFVCADDIAWLVGLTGPRVQGVTGQQLRVVHGLDNAAIDRAMSVIVEAIGERGELTRPKLGEELISRGVSGRVPSAGGQFLMLLLAHAELAGLVCSGRLVDGEHTYALLADRAPSARRLDRDEALGELALRYASGHGPATERDLAYWASLTLGDARRGLGMAQDRLERFHHDGRTYWHAPGERPPPNAAALQPRGHLIQILDESYRGYQHSRWVLDAAGIVPRSREAAVGMALVDRQIVGMARRAISSERVRFEVQPYRPLRAAEIGALEDAGRRYGQFLGREPDLAIQRAAR